MIRKILFFFCATCTMIFAQQQAFMTLLNDFSVATKEVADYLANSSGQNAEAVAATCSNGGNSQCGGLNFVIILFITYDTK